MKFARVGVNPPAAPTNNATVTLFDSTVTFNKTGLIMQGVGRIRFSFPGLNQDSASGGLKGYISGDKGVSWYACTFSAVGSATTLPATVSKDTGSDSSSYDVFIGQHVDVKFTYTAGATAPTIWTPTISLQIGDVHSGL